VAGGQLLQEALQDAHGVCQGCLLGCGCAFEHPGELAKPAGASFEQKLAAFGSRADANGTQIGLVRFAPGGAGGFERVDQSHDLWMTFARDSENNVFALMSEVTSR
jgi:hypothetical protein